MISGSDRLYFFYNAVGSPISVLYNNTRYYYVRNAQGDIVGLTNTSGVLKVAYTYDAWGKPLTTTGSMASTLGQVNPLRYRGYVYDSETGLYYLGSRYYDPAVGRFINADAFVSTGQGFVGNNMFAYCLNNPVSYFDRTGHEAVVVSWVWISASAGLGLVDGILFLVGSLVVIGIASAGDRTDTFMPPNSLVGEDDILYSEDKKLPNQGPVSEIPDAPSVDAGQQGKHVPGHNNKKDKTQWNEGENGVKETQEAWKNGKVVRKDGSVRIGRASDGRLVKVHQGKNGWIHGYPYLLKD